MEEKVYRIWSVLSTFEESSAACISDMLLHVSNGAYVDGVLVAKRFIWHVEVLFLSADRLDQLVSAKNGKGKFLMRIVSLKKTTRNLIHVADFVCRGKVYLMDAKPNFSAKKSSPSSHYSPKLKTRL